MMKVSLKRMFSMLLAIAIVLSMVPASVFAAETTDNTTQGDTTQGDTTQDTNQDAGDNTDENDPELDDTEEECTDVSTAEDLAMALDSGMPKIRVIADITLDRTFYVTSDAMIYSIEEYTLTRAADFGGDLFVVGEAADGTACTSTVILTLGDPNSAQSGLLTVDGNAANMSVDVTGSALFICNGARADLYENLTVTNCTKVGNEKTLTEAYGVSYPVRVGGAVAIVADSGAMNIYGGTYSHNGINDITDSSTEEGQVATQGGAIYNFGTLNVYGGVFENNYAARGGVFYNYRTMHLYNAQLRNNSASDQGGAIYMPASTSAFTYIGEYSELVDSSVTFEGNTSVNNGGAIYAQKTSTIANAQFIGNSSTDGNGGAISAASVNMRLENVSFEGNTASGHGGAITVSGHDDNLEGPGLTAIDCVFSENSVNGNGGAVYLTGAQAYFENVEFTKNASYSTTYGGGALYCTGSTAEINGGSFTENSSTFNGGAVEAHSSSTMILNKITADGNTAKYGGFGYLNNSSITLYNSAVKNSVASGNGGGIFLTNSAVANIYATSFEGNQAATNGGALYVYTGAVQSVLHSCTFTNNTAGNYGGGLYVSNKSLLDMYNTTATGNQADKGGFMYETTSKTTVTVNGLTVSGNTATTAGPIVFGNTANALLYLNKLEVLDMEITGIPGDDYWAAFVANELTVKEISDDFPGYTDYDGTQKNPEGPKTGISVATADELEVALANRIDLICVTADIALDRTFYVTGKSTIYTTEAHTLTRAADFGGDLFVVGENADGVACTNTAVLKLGDPNSTESGLLTIDGNKDNMSVDVTGSVIFVVGGARADLYKNLTVTNCTKVGNEKTLTGDYGVSYTGRVGGAVAIIAAEGAMNIYGGTYSNNSVNDITDSSTEEGQVSTQGGAIYNFGTLNIYGGLFENNHAARAGVFYNYRTMNIYNAQIKNNSASDVGGAIYMPASVSAFTYIGEYSELVQSSVTFEGNTSVNNGGAIYAQNEITVKNAVFKNNGSTAGSGGAIAAYSPNLYLENVTFTGNTAQTHGGAVFVSGQDEDLEGPGLTAINCAFSENTVNSNGGAVYLTGAQAYLENVEFTKNASYSTTYGGGAIYCSVSALEINGGSFTENSSTFNGGAVEAHSSSTMILNKITADGNTAKYGGFGYLNNSSITVYNSAVKNSVASGNGGGIFLTNSAVANIYATSFEGNQAATNGGSLYVYTGAVQSVLHSCTFTNNTAGNYGGGLYVSNKSLLDMYNTTATGNQADKGGFMYETTTKTTVTVNGLTVSGNTATTAGPVIYGNTVNADLYINKANYDDYDELGEWDAAYWEGIFANNLTVSEITDQIPGYTDYDGQQIEGAKPKTSADVRSSAQLERALNRGVTTIRVMADFTLDRTFYITADTTIYSQQAYKLTRAADFGGDLFVVGETFDGAACDSTVVLTLGDPNSTESGLLTIDGNKDNMSVDVTGSVIFVVGGARADLYKNLTVTNCTKVGNEKTLTGDYGVSYTGRVGGAVAIIAAEGAMNIYGGTYSNNSVNDITDSSTEEGQVSTQGGAIYNFGTLNIYGGVFENNHAARAGVFYNYRTMNIYNAQIKNNSASDMGGVIYMPASVSAFTYIGEANELVESSVSFEGNTSVNNGGAIYAQNRLSVKNAAFKNNSSTDSGGGAIAAVDPCVYLEKVTFEGNSAATQGGAVLVSGHADEQEEPGLTATSCSFTGNTAGTNGGAVYLTGAQAYFVKAEFTKNTASVTSYGGGAVYCTGSSLEMDGASFAENTAYNGGGIALYSASTAVLNRITATGNSAVNVGGFLYSSKSEMNMYSSTLTGNSTQKNGGAIGMQSTAVSNIYSTVFEGNTAVNNGGAMYVYTGDSQTLVHSCTFKENVCQNYGGAIYVSYASKLIMYKTTATGNQAENGGFMYETTSGTTVTLNGLTVSGNTATTAGPIIYGNTVNAILYINKANYRDLDVSGELDDAYWASAIVNKLTVYEIDDEIPGYADYGETVPEDMTDICEVATADELEAAILAGERYIRLVADFELDRTFYITTQTTIFSTTARVLTRAADFGGDIFVVGENAEGTSALLLGTNAYLTLGNYASTTADLLTIDGNADNMAVDVTGTVVFIGYSSQADLYDNVTIQNATKVGNERTLDPDYNLSSADYVGGAAVIVANGSLNVYGGNYRNNRVNEQIVAEIPEDSFYTSTRGGAFYNFGNMRVYGGTFENNFAAKGGAIFSYRILKVYEASFVGNYAANNGSAIYLPSSECGQMTIGKVGEEAGDGVLFKGNVSYGTAGALYSGTRHTVVIYGNATFEENASLTGNGGAMAVYGTMNAENLTFRNNRAYARGGAVYISHSDDTTIARIATIQNSTFEDNQAQNGGAIGVYAGTSTITLGAKLNLSGCTFTGNRAADQTADGTGSGFHGGALYISRKATVNVDSSTFSNNAAVNEGGVVYMGGNSTTTFTECEMTGNAGNRGGVVSIHSATLNVSGTQMRENTSETNGGALYISYTTASTVNSVVNIADSAISNNSSGSYGGAIYATEHVVENDHRVLTVRNTSFTGNSTQYRGGAVYLTTGVDAYFKDTVFTQNHTNVGGSKNSGGAVYANVCTLEMDGAEFTQNSTNGYGGAMALVSGSYVVLNDVTATENTSKYGGGFLHNSGSTLYLYNSTVENNGSQLVGGALTLLNEAVTNIYATAFTGNQAGSYGGAAYVYTGGTQTVMHGCTFGNNTAQIYGGALYVSKASDLRLYNTTATGNQADKGGFLYETTSKTVVTVNGLTVSGNTAVTAGPIIFGNTTAATLYINKTNYTDPDMTGALDEDYWASAIVNELTVEEITDEIPGYTDYVGEVIEEEEETTKKAVSVDDVLSLGISSSNGAFNSVYSALPQLDNSSNFMSQNTTTFDNINGETVTVDSFVYHQGDKSDNCTVGEGLLIYQAILYKQAHPEEEVSIDVAAFRLSNQAAVCINRNSRYFGYMRNMTGTQYDRFGFVRISYLLVTAAKMGIHVTVVGQLDGNPHNKTELGFADYFNSYASEPCDPDYVENAVVGDYMNFQECQWTSYGNKGGTDMMHIKMCAVSHYLDMNGVEHKNALYSGSSNLDGISSSAVNGVNKLQTATIVSDHAGLYEATHNYIQLVSQYCEQEAVYTFREIANARATEQIDLILAGREAEIAAGEQIVYLGSETDDVFELYFAPFGGDSAVWDETYNPYCKYLRDMYESDDYILFAWNNASFNEFPLGTQMEEMISASFHENANINNSIYVNLAAFDHSAYNDLTVGENIGYKSFNTYDFGSLHNKDILMSYSQNGQRYYVSLLNSMNIHSGSMSYQSNFMLVIKETDCSEDSVFFTMADLTTKGIVEHNYGEEQTYLPEDGTDGYSYKTCQDCGKTVTTGVVHRESDWIVDKEATASENGIQHKVCLACGDMLESCEFTSEESSSVSLSEINGKKFTSDTGSQIPVLMDGMPYTIEATVQLNTPASRRAGVIVGNYDAGTGDQVNLEIYTYGRVRLYYINNGEKESCLFNTDIRSDEPTNIAVTVDGLTATLYVNGEAVETAELSLPYPENAQNFVIGGDRRNGNPYYFRGTIYCVSMFGDVRTAQEVAKDAILVTSDADALLYTSSFSTEEAVEITAVESAGMTFSQTDTVDIGDLAAVPHTVEAVIQIAKDAQNCAGVIAGNYDAGTGKQMNLEVAENGALQLVLADGELTEKYTFTTDVRSDGPTHIALTVEGVTATLYVNGEVKETLQLNAQLPEATRNFMLGGDNRADNTAYFTGRIYSANLFAQARTAEQIMQDMIWVDADEEGLLYTVGFASVDGSQAASGITFSANESIAIEETFSSVPHTIEATVKVPKSMSARAGVIVGNYSGGTEGQVNLEVYLNGRVRLYYISNGDKVDCQFKTDIRSNSARHIAVTVDGLSATLYVDGKVKETTLLSAHYPETAENFVVGGDNRTGNAQYFRGTIYSVAMFGDVRTAEEIAKDAAAVPTQEEGLLYSKSYTAGQGDEAVRLTNLAGNTFSATENCQIDSTLNGTPHTIEAIVQLSKDVKDRGGVIVGNYDAGDGEQLNLEIYTKGRVRLFYVAGGQRVSCLFATDIRSEEPKHIAVAVDGLDATLYINGEAAETAKLSAAYTTASENFMIGGDHRYANSAYFKGMIYAVNMFAQTRTAEQIKQDAIAVAGDTQSLLYSANFALAEEPAEYTADDGLTFSTKKTFCIEESLNGTPNTIEATIQVPKSMDDRGGVVVGNYVGGVADQMNLEVYTYGRIRLFYVANGQRYDHVFSTDVRSDKPVHVAITVNGMRATLYVDGIAREAAQLSAALPELKENFCIGGDNRVGNYQYFRGTIYSVSLFDDVRTSAEIRKDTINVPADAESLLYVKYFTAPECSENAADGVHVESDWIVDFASTDSECGVMHTQCVYCGKAFKVGQIGKNIISGVHLEYQQMQGMSFATPHEIYPIGQSLSAKPLTIEATIQLDKSYSSRAGVVVGNYDNTTSAQVNLEIYTNGRPRLWYKLGSASYTYNFTTDIRSANKTHIAVTIDGLTAHLYVNGEWKESVELKKALPDALANYCIGGDNRLDNTQYFKGTIYSVSLFEDVRTAQEIAWDAILVAQDTQGLLYCHYFVTDEAK